MADTKKEKTVNFMKEKRTVTEEVKTKVKEFNKLKRTILKVLESGNKTIPQISKETNLSTEIVTKSLMTLIKYGKINPVGMDDMDEYYFYELKKKI
ncbi:MAG: hypothetical protein U9R42_11140 [Bacteroidota bacterium]|nr:hypothetical protein [Bacteroidota bacterium]